MPQLCKTIFYHYPRMIIRTAIVILNNLYCIPTYVIWMMLLLPVKRCRPDLYYKIEGFFFHWLLSVVASWSYTAGYDIVELGDDIRILQKPNTRTLMLANHQSTADVPLLMACFSVKPRIIPNIMWIMDHVFKFTNFGVVSILHQDFFVKAGRKTRDETVIRLREHLRDFFVPQNRQYMVLFPEGGFLRKRREVSHRFAEKNNLPKLNNVTLPRTGAMNAILDVLPLRTVQGNNNAQKKIENGRPTFDKDETISYQSKEEENKTHLDYVLDITIAYPDVDEPLDILDVVTGRREPCKTYFLYKIYHTSELPQDETALTKWLYDRWIEKEATLEEYYRTGQFTYPGKCQPTVVEQDLLRLSIINLFFITSTYVHYKLFYLLCGYINSYL